MKTVTKFIADDGSEWDSEPACRKRDALIRKIAALTVDVPKKPEDKGCKYANGEGYLKWPAGLAAKLREAVVDLVIAELGPDSSLGADLKKGRNFMFAGRIADDNDMWPIYSLFSRLIAVDSYNREWGQPYYAAHPDEGKKVCLNP